MAMARAAPSRHTFSPLRSPVASDTLSQNRATRAVLSQGRPQGQRCADGTTQPGVRKPPGQWQTWSRGTPVRPASPGHRPRQEQCLSARDTILTARPTCHSKNDASECSVISRKQQPQSPTSWSSTIQHSHYHSSSRLPHGQAQYNLAITTAASSSSSSATTT